MARLLLQAGADKDRASTDGRTPLWQAALNGHEAVVRLLLEAGADMDRAHRGRTPRRAAALKRHEAVVRLLCNAGARDGRCCVQ